jgi:hypothetical protein
VTPGAAMIDAQRGLKFGVGVRHRGPVTLLRSFDDHEYWPEYGTFLIRDAPPIPSARPQVSELLGEYVVATQPCGSVARAGLGWLDGLASDAHHDVRLEAHDSAPVLDLEGWPDVVETPMATAGIMGLTTVTGGSGPDPFRVGPPGLYRVRFAGRPAGAANAYRLQFWPVETSVATPLEPPRWLARTPHPERRADAALAYLASDLIACVLWAQEGGTELTVRVLADRLLLTPDTVREVIERAVRGRTLAPIDVPGDPAQPIHPVVMPNETFQRNKLRSETLQARLPVPEALARLRAADLGGPTQRPTASPMVTRGPSATAVPTRGPDVATGTSAGMSIVVRASVVGQPTQPELPEGAPPRVGVIGTNGVIVVWHDGEPVEIAQWVGPSVKRAQQCRHGIVVFASNQIAILRPDGVFDPLATDALQTTAIDGTGTQLAYFGARLGRSPSSRLHLVNLRDGSRESMPNEYPDIARHVLGLHDGAVYLDDRTSSQRWRPRTEPESLPWRARDLDPYTGIILASDHDSTDREPGSLLVHPDGTVRRVALDPAKAYQLAPGGRHLVTWRSEPPAMSLVDVADPTTQQLVALPATSRVGSGPLHPIWEDADHVLVVVDAGDTPLVRVDVRTQRMESVALPPALRYRPRLIEPTPADVS